MPNALAVRLGRVQSAPDPRNWQLTLDDRGAVVLTKPAAAADPIDAALAAFLATKRIPDTAKTLAQLVVDRVKQLPIPIPAPIPDPPPLPTDRFTWHLGEPGVLDQGDTPHCVGFTGADFLNLDPVEDHVANSVGDDIYDECKIIDGEPGVQDGSSIHSLAKALKARGRIGAYAWISAVDTVKAYVRNHGPVPIGIDWTDDMFEPNAQGFIAPTGAIAGGHAITIVGDYADLDAALVLNHWGDWGPLHGYFLMKWHDLGTLLSASRGGEAVAMLELPL